MRQCLPLFHEYGKWEEHSSGRYTRFGEVVGYYVSQKRLCAKCGKLQIKKRDD